MVMDGYNVWRTMVFLGLGFLAYLFIAIVVKSVGGQSTGVPVEAVTTADGKPDIGGTLVFENREGQCIRMWQMEHRMEAWLMEQKNIRIENIYGMSVPQEHPWQYRFYVRYQLLTEKP